MKTKILKKRKRTGTSLPFLSRLKSLTVLSLFSLTAGAQIQAPVTPPTGASTTRSIEGVVTDGQKQPVSDAVVLLKDTKTLQIRSYLVQKDGRFHFFGLSSDINYEVRAQNANLMSKPKVVSVFDSHKVVTLHLQLTKKKKL